MYSKMQKISTCLTKLIKYNKHKHKKSNWVTFGIIKSIQFRDNLYKKTKNDRSLSVEFTRLQINLKTYNKILKISIRLAKRIYYKKLFAKFKNDIRATWKTINEILNRTKRKKFFPNFFRDGNNIISNKINISNKFNSFFTNVGKNLNNAINLHPDQSFNHYLKNRYNLKLTFRNIDEENVSELINKLSQKTSFDFDGISAKLQKHY